MVKDSHIAVLAVLIVAALIGGGFMNTGNFIINNPTKHLVDLAAVGASFPEKLDKTFYIGSVTLANYGTTSASNVEYSVLVTQAVGGAMIWQYDDRVSLQAGETHTYELPAFDITPGTYHVKVFADSAYDFNEADEANNVYEADFTVTR